MTAATSLLAYGDCLKLMERAHEFKEGIRVKFADHNAANNFRMRIHKARALDRQANAELYPEGHRLHGRSVYDDLFATIQVHNDVLWLYLERRQIETMTIEPLGEANEQERSNSDSGEVQGETSEGGDEATREVEELFKPDEGKAPGQGITRRV